MNVEPNYPAEYIKVVPVCLGCGNPISLKHTFWMVDGKAFHGIMCHSAYKEGKDESTILL